MTVISHHGQWDVTDFGIEAVEPESPCEYLIDAERLPKVIGQGTGRYYKWPVHMAEKSWVDQDRFIEAFTSALEHHAASQGYTVDQELLDRSIQRAREVHQRERRSRTDL